MSNPEVLGQKQEAWCTARIKHFSDKLPLIEALKAEQKKQENKHRKVSKNGKAQQAA